MRNVLMVLRVLVFATPVLHAQGTGTIHGSVTDASTAAVVNAKVTAILEERGTTRAATTDSQGTYVFPLLPIGSYTIRIEVNGFKVFVRSGIELSASENDRVDAQLEIGDTSQSVTVAAEAPMVDSRSSVVGTLIDTRRVTDLPTNGRNVISLAGILPGVPPSARHRRSPGTAAVRRCLFPVPGRMRTCFCLMGRSSMLFSGIPA